MNLNSMTPQGLQFGSVDVSNDLVRFHAGPKTDWFHSPLGESRCSNVPRLVLDAHQKVFSLSAKVEVGFGSPYDAGAIFIESDAENWAKIAYEYSAERNPTIVSVVTRTTSDDSDGPNFIGSAVYLRLYCNDLSAAFHFSEDGGRWKFLRWFTIPRLRERPCKIGLGAQSPTGDGVDVKFSDIRLSFDEMTDLRNGD